MTTRHDVPARAPRRTWTLRLLVALAVALAGLVLPTPPAASAATVAGPYVPVSPARVLDTRSGNGATGPVGSYSTISLQITGRGGVPASGVAAVVLNVTVSQPQVGGYLTVFPDGTALPNASNVNFSAGQTVPNLVTVKVSSAGKVAISNRSSGGVQVIADVEGYYLSGSTDAAGSFAPLAPSRILDTRVGNGATGPVPANSTVQLQVSGRGGVPAVGVAAVVLNVTASQPQSSGYLTVYPGGGSRPTASNINFPAGGTVANLVTVELSSTGTVSITNTSSGSTQIIADVEGYFLPGWVSAPGSFVPLSPARVLDTRSNLGATGPVAANSTVHLQVTGKGGVPMSGVGAVVLNVTVTTPRAGGYLRVYPDSATVPTSSNVNFTAGQTVANQVVVKVSSAGKVAITNTSSGTVQIIADVSGYYLNTLAGSFVPLSPTRVLDTRSNIGAGGPVAANSTIRVQISGKGGVPASGAMAVVLNVTVTSPQKNGFLTVYPDSTTTPNASTLNFAAGQTVPNLVTVKLSSAGKVAITNTSGGTVQVIADVSGYYVAGTAGSAGALVPLSPSRVLDTRSNIGAQGPVGSYSTIDVQITGHGGVPTSGVAAVVLNITATRSQAAGYLTAFPSGSPLPTASNLNFAAGQTVANLAVVKLSSTGKVAISNRSGGTVEMIADVSGYYLSGTVDSPGGFVPVSPSRILDTRSNTGASGPVASHATIHIQASGRGGVPASGVTAVVLNITVSSPQAEGYLTAYPDATALPTASNVNFAAGQTVANLAVVKVSADGKVAITNSSSGDVQIIADVSGYVFAADANYGPTQPAPPPPPATPPATPVQLSAGASHNCVVTAGGATECWGWNYNGQLGNGTTTDSAAPVTVTGLSTGAAQVSAGWTSTCVVTTAGAVRCFGDNATGIAGPSAGSQTTKPMTVITSGIKQVSVGWVSACALTTGGGVKCWGNNFNGELGNGSTSDSYTPVWASGITGAKQVAVGDGHACAITSGNTVVCWGANGYGQLGDGTHTTRTKPVAVSGLTGVTDIAASAGTTCAVSNGAVKCWGENDTNQLGDGTTTSRSTPIQVAGLTSGWKAVDLGLLGGCALNGSGAERCWGGHVGTSADYSSTPVTTFGSGISAIAVGDDHSCSLLADGTAKCWGDNSMKQLGNQTSVSFTATPVNGPKFV